jgi:hypothetical protein
LRKARRHQYRLVLAGAKIWLERGIEPGFVPDRHPDA